MAQLMCPLLLAARYDHFTAPELRGTNMQQNGLSIHYTRNDQTLKYVQRASFQALY
jgi:hypothetical protein